MSLSSCLTSLDDANDDSEQAKGRAENFDDQDLHEGGRGLSIRQCATSSSDSDADSAEEVRETDRETSSKDSECGPESAVNFIHGGVSLLEGICPGE